MEKEAPSKIGRPHHGRLAGVAPVGLADRVVDAIKTSITRTALRIGVQVIDAGPCDLRETIIDLARYAIDGVPLDSCVGDYLADLDLLWRRVVDDDGQITIPVPEDPDIVNVSSWQGQMTIIIRAAMCRESLDRGDPVSPGDLGALAGYSTSNIRKLISTRAIVAIGNGGRWRIDATSAREWLESL